MNLSFIYESGAGIIVATAILVLFFLLLVGAVLGFIFTVKKERNYAKTALPDLGLPPGEDEDAASTTDDIDSDAPSAFFLEDDEENLNEDEDSRELMQDLFKARKAERNSETRKTKRFF